MEGDLNPGGTLPLIHAGHKRRKRCWAMQPSAPTIWNGPRPFMTHCSLLWVFPRCSIMDPADGFTVRRVARCSASLALSTASQQVSETDRCSRSEEHTSELQSLMLKSYAVFCLK